MRILVFQSPYSSVNVESAGGSARSWNGLSLVRDSSQQRLLQKWSGRPGPTGRPVHFKRIESCSHGYGHRGYRSRLWHVAYIAALTVARFYNARARLRATPAVLASVFVTPSAIHIARPSERRPQLPLQRASVS